MVGTTISHYKVIEKIGQGGMGEVYRAEDTNLSRDVAIKVLPEQFTQDPQRLARFEREAKLLASLNHPNIAAIYGFEEADGVRFLALELVPGETLQERVARGPVPVEEAMEICRQIAEGVEAAHEKGVIHRDLKPANVKVTPEGKVKILDFGLAKAFEAEPPVTDISQSPTLTEEMTRAGVILGTAAYMSPEQAKGKPVDKRADIFAFGAVLYELLTGKRAFQGETITETIAAVLKSEPEWKALPAITPWRIQELLRRCLNKDPHDRLDGIANVRIEIKLALVEPATSSPIGVSGATQPARRGWIVTVGLVLAGAAISSLAVWSLMRPAPPRLARFAISEPPNVFFAPGSTPTVTISPDGTRIVYVGQGSQLYVRAVDQLDAVALRGGIGVNPFISPDGNWVGFRGRLGDDTLKKVSIHGGPPVVLSEGFGGIAGASWGADDSIIFGTEIPNGLFRVSAAGGEERELLTNLEEGESGHRWPQILPGGRTVLFTVERGPGDANLEIAALNLETGERKLLIPGGSNPHYAASGHIVYGADGMLRAVPLDLDAVEVKGDPIPVLEGVVTQVRGAAHFSLAEDGTLVYVPGTGGDVGEQLTFVWVDREGREEPVAAEPRAYQEFSLSPDGTKIAVRVIGPENEDVWIYDLVRDIQMRLTFGSASEQFPLWTPDGQRVAFGSPAGPLSWKAADGTGEVETLVESLEALQYPLAFSPDGTALVFHDRSSRPYELGMLSLEGERISTDLLETEFTERNAVLSPDGRWMAYSSGESGQFELYVRPFPDVNSGRWQVSSGGGEWPLWSPDGRELFYVGSEGMMVVSIELEPTFTQGTEELLFDLGPYWKPFERPNRRIAISPEGDRFLMFKSAGGVDETAQTTSIIVVQNWFEELKRLVPGP